MLQRKKLKEQMEKKNRIMREKYLNDLIKHKLNIVTTEKECQVYYFY